MIVKLDMMQTAALAAIIFYFGGYVKSKVPILTNFVSRILWLEG